MSEVLLTDWRSVSELDFTLGAQWPRGHSFYPPIAERWHDPVLMAETIRQAGLLIAHSAFGVPLGTQFMMGDLTFEVDPHALACNGRPAELSLMVTAGELRRRGPTISAMRIHVHVMRDGRPLGTGNGVLGCASAAAYRRLRGERIGAVPDSRPPLPVRRRWSAGTGLRTWCSPTGDIHTWMVRSETGHPVLFDHQVDHLPGMVLVEAMRQAACLTTGWPELLVTALDSRFEKYAEFDRPCLVRAEKGRATLDGTPVRVLLEQNGATVAEGRLLVRSTG
ncbi:hypothetical protein GXW82_41275 [Streptacidiphilus sp. 4-A2]|nr:hypothetical protein [Streptacidiphilus sp. 4-A2]